MRAIIEIDEVWRIYQTSAQQIAALRGVSMQVEQGHFLALKGKSGSGKTTLINCVGALDKPNRGCVRVMGEDLSTWDDERLTHWRRNKIGFIFQSYSLIATLSAYENVELMPLLHGVSYVERHDLVLKCLNRVGLSERIHHRPDELSGGQQQRVAIARSLANRAPLILADEPTGELDTNTAREILALFRQIVQEDGVTVLMVSHDQLVDEYADEILQLQDGQIIG